MKRKYKHDPQHVRDLLTWLTIRLINNEPDQSIELSHDTVGQIVKILGSLREAKVGQPGEWTHEIEAVAILDMLGGKSVSATASWIAEETGQDEGTAERRLYDLRKTPQYLNWKKR
jgi:hypothetical protein